MSRQKKGELKLFKEIAEEREHRCQCCGKQLYDLGPINFSHILGKGAYPAYRLLKENIWIKCKYCHHDWDFGNKFLQKFDELRKFAEYLKAKYNREEL